MSATVPFVRVTAPGRGHGKTELASRLIAELARRGHRVAAVKHSHHPLPLDKPGSDTERFAQAGAAAVVFCGSDGTLVRRPETSVSARRALAQLTGEFDLAVVEGYRTDTGGAVITLGEGSPAPATLARADGTTLLVTHAGAIEALADALERELLGRAGSAGEVGAAAGAP